MTDSNYIPNEYTPIADDFAGKDRDMRTNRKTIKINFWFCLCIVVGLLILCIPTDAQCDDQILSYIYARPAPLTPYTDAQCDAVFIPDDWVDVTDLWSANREFAIANPNVKVNDLPYTQLTYYNNTPRTAQENGIWSFSLLKVYHLRDGTRLVFVGWWWDITASLNQKRIIGHPSCGIYIASD